jgi:hypothetical protein
MLGPHAIAPSPSAKPGTEGRSRYGKCAVEWALDFTPRPAPSPATHAAPASRPHPMLSRPIMRMYSPRPTVLDRQVGMRQQRWEGGQFVKHLQHGRALGGPADREHLTMRVHAHDPPLGRHGMHDPETVAVKQRVELGPEWAKAAGLDLHELPVSTDQVDHKTADRHLQPVTRRRQRRLDGRMQLAFAQHADARHAPEARGGVGALPPAISASDGNALGTPVRAAPGRESGDKRDARERQLEARLRSSAGICLPIPATRGSCLRSPSPVHGCQGEAGWLLRLLTAAPQTTRSCVPPRGSTSDEIASGCGRYEGQELR